MNGTPSSVGRYTVQFAVTLTKCPCKPGFWSKLVILAKMFCNDDDLNMFFLPHSFTWSPVLFAIPFPNFLNLSVTHYQASLILQLIVLQHCRSTWSDNWENHLQMPAGVGELWAVQSLLVWSTEVEAIQLIKYMGASHNEMWKVLVCCYWDLLLTKYLKSLQHTCLVFTSDVDGKATMYSFLFVQIHLFVLFF